MKDSEILDYDEFYNDDEQTAYDHGFEKGLLWGIVASAVTYIVILLIDNYII